MHVHVQVHDFVYTHIHKIMYAYRICSNTSPGFYFLPGSRDPASYSVIKKYGQKSILDRSVEAAAHHSEYNHTHKRLLATPSAHAW